VPVLPQPTTATSSSDVTLHFAWPAPAEAEVDLVSEHDFGEGTSVSATYRYHLTVRRDDGGYLVSRTGITLVEHAGAEPLRLGNVLAQDVVQHVGDFHVDDDATNIAPRSGFEPIESAAQAILSEGGIDGAYAEAVLVLTRTGWEPLNVVDYDTMLHEWNGRTFTSGVIQPADATEGASATRIMSSASWPCSEAPGAPTCVEVVRTEQGERGADRIAHVYTLLTEASTLRPHRFQHEARTDSAAAHLHYAETWTTTFHWQ
jgi:hypothetical protein